MPSHELEVTPEVEQLIREQGERSGELDLMENLRKALALRHAIWEVYRPGCVLILKCRDGSQCEIPLI